MTPRGPSGVPSPVWMGWKMTPEWGQMNWSSSFTFWKEGKRVKKEMKWVKKERKRSGKGDKKEIKWIKKEGRGNRNGRER